MAKLKREFTKCAVDARKTAGLTQEEAAEVIGCSVNTLQKYEADDLRIHDDMAYRMSMVYRDPRLTRLYCEHECAIGSRDGHCGCERPPEALMLDLLLMDQNELHGVVKTLRDIMADGVIDDNETGDRDRCLTFLDHLSKNIDALKLQVQRAGLAGREGY